MHIQNGSTSSILRFSYHCVFQSLSETELQRAYYQSPKRKPLVFYSCKWYEYASELQRFREAKLVIYDPQSSPT